MRPYGRTSGTLRLVAASVSLALTLAVFLLLRATSAPAPAKRAEMHVGVTVFPLPPARREAAPPPSAATPVKGGTRSTASVRSRSPVSAARLGPEPEPAVASSGLSAGVPAESPAASAPLRIDPQTIRRAIAGTEGNIQQMARRSGVELDSPRASHSEVLAGTVAETVVPDCLAPKGGGSLLSAPVLLLMAIQGKCK